ncbi:MAG TPA: transketolase C-terminal domain-containing protein [Opitutaceae bacterium]|nr:transketolase C-terminal domain-containing protein [Opitutaceae bacterium]
MRDAFAKIVTELGRQDERLVLLSGDIGNRMFDQFKEEHPDRFYNCGVAEANMVSMAAGLAMAGFRPWIYTIASFLTYRPFEQIRVDAAYHGLPIVFVGTGAGLSYATNGPTHHCLEDIALYRVLGGFRIACPGDALEVSACARELQNAPGPAYLRLGKKGEPKIFTEPPAAPLGRARQMRPGQHAALLSTGNLLPETTAACAQLAARGLDVAHWHFPWVQPIDADALAEVFASVPLVVTAEEHCIDGGFGSLVAEWRAEQVSGARLLRAGTPRRFLHVATEQAHARHECGIDAAGLVARIEAALAEQTARTLSVS